MRQTTLSGKVIDRPQVREIAKARSVARFSLIVAEGGGTTWHAVVGWGATADQAKAILPGDAVTVTGRVVSRSFQAKAGERTVTELMASNIQRHGN